MNTFAIAINCIDGRTLIPVIDYIKNKYNVDYIDLITEPGPNKILSENKDRRVLDSIKKKIDISVKNHNSKVIAIVGHYDCAANPVDKETHLKQIQMSIDVIKSFGFNIDIIGL